MGALGFRLGWPSPVFLGGFQENAECSPKSEENTTAAGWVAAREVCQAFQQWVCDQPVSLADLPERAVYEWLETECTHPRWRRSRLNRALPQRAVMALLVELAYPRVDNIAPFFARRGSMLELAEWLTELSTIRAIRPDDPQWLWNVYAALYDQVHPPKTVREKLRRWNCYLRRSAPTTVTVARVSHDPAVPLAVLDPANSDIDPFIRFFVVVRWPGDGEAVLAQCFRPMAHYASHCPDHRHGRAMHCFLRPVLYVFVALASTTDGVQALLPVLATARRADVVEALAMVNRNRGRAIKAVFQLTHGAWAGLVGGPGVWERWAPITRQEVGHRPLRRARQRDRFTEEEVNRLRAAAASDPLDHGLFTLFLHTVGGGPMPAATPPPRLGCRSGAACSLRVDDVWDAASGTPRPVGSVEEKGTTRREFTIDPVLGDALGRAIACNRGSAYVFPAHRGIGRRPEGANDLWLRRLCTQCGIHGDHVHVHALRRTTISMLLDAGNPLAVVSQWIGHTSTEPRPHHIFRLDLPSNDTTLLGAQPQFPDQDHAAALAPAATNHRPAIGEHGGPGGR